MILPMKLPIVISKYLMRVFEMPVENKNFVFS